MAAKWVCSDDIRGRQEPVLTKASDAKDQSLRVCGLSSLAANHSGRAVLKIDALGEEVRCVLKFRWWGLRCGVEGFDDDRTVKDESLKWPCAREAFVVHRDVMTVGINRYRRTGCELDLLSCHAKGFKSTFQSHAWRRGHRLIPRIQAKAVNYGRHFKVSTFVYSAIQLTRHRLFVEKSVGDRSEPNHVSRRWIAFQRQTDRSRRGRGLASKEIQ